MDAVTYERIAVQAPFFDEGHGFDVFGLHPPRLARVVGRTRLLYERYFRVDSRGIDHIPASGPVILIANHAGILPMDAALLCLDVLFRTNPARIPRAVGDHFIPRLPLISALFARLGVVSGTPANVRRLLERGELLVLFPEGTTGPAKRFRDRYRLQTWRVGFAEHAIRHRAVVVPVAIIGAEESWPLLAKLPLRAFGSPYVPVPAVPLPLPAHYHLRYGTPMMLGHASEDADDPGRVAAGAARVRDALEELVVASRQGRRGWFR
ncbi:MAG: lysophospholipid acyltransferase family protein [Kofleriaceae bacterium]|nr:lysophospholipid acyltransferase family protein [Kofleriaceae bacterium]